MATKKRKPGHKVVFVETPEDVADRLAAVAEHNRRSVTAEAIVAFERHVKSEEARIKAEGAPLPESATAAPKKKLASKGGK
jgi:hypothetical protein